MPGQFCLIMADSPYGPIRIDKMLLQNPYSLIAYATHDIHGPIIAKIYKFNELEEVSQIFRELFLQAKFTHPNVCLILDVYLTSSTVFELILCLERLEMDVAQAIEKRLRPLQSYREEELWDFLHVTTTALCAAQRVVRPT